MLNTRKFFYIMPDSAYIAELLPTKKEHSFTIQVFRQINGEFLDDNEFIAANVEKLIKKIDPDEYHLILPDFLFTNTIVDVNDTHEGEVKKYIKEKLLPDLELSKEEYELDTFILTQHKGKSKVQLSALEKSLLAPIQKACEEQKVKIAHISPLSWTIKSIVSLEPSLSTIQMGSMLYLAQHYIGVDQTISFKIEDVANIVETVKTLKGAEPNIQTMYLLTNLLVENEIKEKLSGTLPIQQLANFADEQEGMPSHIKQIIEASARTLDISDYPVPSFSLGKYIAAEIGSPPLIKTTPDTELEKETSGENSKEEDAGNQTELPTPNLPLAVPTPVEEELPPVILEKTQTESKVIEESSKETTITQTKEEVVLPPKKITLDETTETSLATAAIRPNVTVPAFAAKPSLNLTPSAPTPTPQANMVPLGYIQNQTGEEMSDSTPEDITHVPSNPPRVIIKNKSGTGSLLKVVAITLGALLITVGLGVGIGFGLLSYTQKRSSVADQNKITSSSVSPSPVATTQPTVSPSPSPTTVAKDKVKILVVNATKTAGRAGKVKTTLTGAGYKSVDTGNAQGQYPTPGTFVLMDNQDQSFIDTLSKDLGTTLTYKATKSIEDSKGVYDVVIVINE